MVLSDKTIIDLATSLINPFNPENVGPATVDLTLTDTFLLVEGHKTGGLIRMDRPVTYERVCRQEFVLPPNRFVLASTVEVVRLPDDICAEVIGRSSVGRLGLFVENAGWIDPGFEGNITLELFNANEYPIILEAGRRVCQIVFYRMDRPVLHPYNGKYQGHRAAGTVGSRVFDDREVGR